MKLVLQKSKYKKGLSESGVAKIMVTPALIIIFGLAVYPLIYTIWISFADVNLLKGESVFVGLKQYLAVFSSVEFWSSLKVTLYFTIVSILVQLPLGILVALLLNQEFHGRWLVRSIILIPWAVPTLVNATLWDWIYNVQYGVLNRMLLQLHLIEKPIIWLETPLRAMNAVILADTWRMLPLYVIMILASLQTIDKARIEAAIIDGAGVFRRFISVILPLIKPMVMVILVIRTMQALKVFDIVYMLTHGGPANGTMVVSYFIYDQTFSFMKFGYGAALAIFVAVTSLLISLIYVRVLRSEDLY